MHAHCYDALKMRYHTHSIVILQQKSETSPHESSSSKTLRRPKVTVKTTFNLPNSIPNPQQQQLHNKQHPAPLKPKY